MKERMKSRMAAIDIPRRLTVDHDLADDERAKTEPLRRYRFRKSPWSEVKRREWHFYFAQSGV
jgi:hypothetical protein